jgi:adenylate cyclase
MARTKHWSELLTTPPGERTPLGIHGKRAGRWMFGHLPGDPRCKLCHAPFTGVSGRIVGALGKKPSRLTPYLCSACERIADRQGGGAELEASILFADIRDSTRLAERMTPTEFGGLVDRFFRETTHVLTRAGAFIEKLGGDEVVAFFVPGFAGSDHAVKAVDAARQLLVATGHGDGATPWVPVGVGLHVGNVYVGVVGEDGGAKDMAVLGDAANVGARLASHAGRGEVLISAEAAGASGLETTRLGRRTLDLKGKTGPTTAFVITLGTVGIG